MLVITIDKYYVEYRGIDEWLTASPGSYVLLVLALPNSPTAQAWGVIAGNALLALVVILTVNLFTRHCWLPLSPKAAVLGMFMLRCLHPPATVVVLITALGRV